jgi:hypothetical protein
MCIIWDNHIHTSGQELMLSLTATLLLYVFDLVMFHIASRGLPYLRHHDHHGTFHCTRAQDDAFQRKSFSIHSYHLKISPNPI